MSILQQRLSQSLVIKPISLNQFAEQVPLFKKRYLYAKDFATATMKDIFETEEGGEPFLKLQCDELHTCWFENIGNGKFIKHFLPAAV